ncbi:glycoside hydrolase [Arthrobacter phage Zucker]|nr:glycoside hydrolase [Arthrobacter phage Zucker]
MAYTFDYILAADPSNPTVVARNGVVTIFEVGDVTKTPVELKTVDGQPLPNPVTVNANGFGPKPVHDTLDHLAWEGGGFSGTMTSYEGMKEEVVSARQAAESAATEAGAAAQADLEARIAAGDFRGQPGQDGSNVVPTATAIATEISTPGSPAATALSATYARKGGIDIVAPEDGLFDATAGIQAALNSAAPGQTVQGKPGAVYRIATSQTSTTFTVPSGTATMPCGLVIPNGVTLDMRNATLLLGGVDMVLVTNNAAFTNAGSPDVGGGLINAVLDGNNQTLTNKWLVQMAKLDRFQLDVEIKNVNHGGIQIYNATRIRSRHLRADTVAGQPYGLGYPAAGMGVSDSTFGLISAKNVTPDPSNTFNYPGNGFYGELQRCTIDTIVTKNCTAGIKLAETCVDLTIGKINTDSCGDSQGNSGVKFQGSSATSGPSRIHVGQITATNQWAHGLWMERSNDCVVDSYVGYNNQTGGTGADVWVGGNRDQIGSIKSILSGSRGVYFRPYAADIHIGSAHVLNPGGVATANGDKTALVVAGGTGVILNFTATDDRGTHLMYRGISVDDATAQVQVARARVTGQVDVPINVVASAATVLDTQVAGTTTTAAVRLTAAAASLTSGQAIQTFLKAGTYNYTLPCTGTTTNNSLGNGTLRATPWYVPRAVTVSRIGAEITAAGDAGSTLRLGIYAGDGSGYPGALVAGTEATIPADAVAVAEATINATINPGVYWVVAVVQGVTTTQPTVRVPANVMVSIGRPSIPSANNSDICYAQTGVTGALPATFSTSISTAGQAPRVFVKVT